MTDQPRSSKISLIARLKGFRRVSTGMSLEIYTDKMGESAQTLFRRAYEEARTHHDRELRPEHALIAFAETEAVLFDQLLNSLGLDRFAVPLSVSEKSKEGAPQYEGMKISPGFRELLHEGLKHARENGRRLIESTDILFALFADKRGSIVKHFRRLGSEQEAVLRRIRELIRQ